ncbi:MAG: hypothetical protein A2Z14_10690 [Chloroflexi bacterium RBG_16_48_8]|nr:MAG: hypothetical protein A2Z14_10690 [Chloroflexi bacterium RBG_16_48_8]
MSQISIQVITPVLTNFFHCMHCEQVFHYAGIGQQMHQEVIEKYPEDVKEEASHLTDWILEITRRYPDRIHFRVIDPTSLEGFLLCLRYWVRRYPTFIVNGRKVFVGSDQDHLECVLQTYLKERPVGTATISRNELDDEGS